MENNLIAKHKFNIGDTVKLKKCIVNGKYAKWFFNEIFTVTACYPLQDGQIMYTLAVEANKKLTTDMSEEYIDPVIRSYRYYYINTEGMICETFEGENEDRDFWLDKAGLKFKTKQNAREYYNKIINN